MSDDNTYEIGNVIRIYGSFTNLAGVATNPTEVTITYQLNDGTSVVKLYSLAEVTKGDDGYFYYDYLTTESGKLEATVAGTGAVTASGPTSWWIEKSKVL